MRLCKAAAVHSALQGGFYAVRHPSGMMFCGAVPRNAGASGDAAVRFVLLTFHHRRVVPSGAVKIRFQSKGFSLVEVLSSCPTNWGLRPVEAFDWTLSSMMPYYPLGVFKDFE